MAKSTEGIECAVLICHVVVEVSLAGEMDKTCSAAGHDVDCEKEVSGGEERTQKEDGTHDNNERYILRLLTRCDGLRDALDTPPSNNSLLDQ